jgi:GntR family transcriptional regulator
MRSYAYLQDLGIIYNQRGIGYFVAEDAYALTLEQKKRNFVRRELPQVFKTMDLLHLSCEDLRTLYEQNQGKRHGGSKHAKSGKERNK